jgi:hypothetical protein
VWPVGEEWLFQAWATSWLPVTRMLEQLAAEGHRDLLTLGVTPLVAHQVADRRLAQDLGHLARRPGLAQRGAALAPPPGARDPVAVDVLLASVRDAARLPRGRPAPRGVDRGVGAAGIGRGHRAARRPRHPPLPAPADRPGLIDAQLTTGLDAHAGWAGRHPTGLWPPELAYRPRGQVGDPTAAPRGRPSTAPRRWPARSRAPGARGALPRHGIDHVLVDAATLVTAAGGDEDRDWTVRPGGPRPGRGVPRRGRPRRGPDRRQRRRRVRPRPVGRLPRVVPQRGLPGGCLVPRLLRDRRVRGAPVLAGHRPRAAAGPQGALRPVGGDGRDRAGRRPPARGPARGARPPARASSSWPPTTPSCSATGGSRASSGSRRCSGGCWPTRGCHHHPRVPGRADPRRDGSTCPSPRGGSRRGTPAG